tara:strand:+ start:497 stop:739 length:243 start_codon:yes stop_codon:yes gene_type:complete
MPDKDWSPIDKSIVDIREMTASEASMQGWDEGEWQYKDGMVIELNDGSLLFPSADWEGNRAGALFGFVQEDCVYIKPRRN